uniref:sprouty-related, EVH1 domain-containing protein 3 isoform X4 n=1 Tax=Monopterus albus TaxID=43700 RepID=UPI0009B3F76F|nr:sprouty-related, EVH1 domain-containing protein 3 isoform X4 [Monopterus albus]
MEGDVRVRAVVMTRDDSSGGWVPLGGGGLSHVVICKGRSHDGRGRREYIIRGERLRDRAPVLECAVQKGLVYNKVNPIFHHWRVEDRKFGLTFQSPADAISFEKGLQAVIDKLDRGSDSPSSSTPEEADTEDDGQASHTGSESSSNSRKEMLPKPITIVTNPHQAGTAPAFTNDGCVESPSTPATTACSTYSSCGPASLISSVPPLTYHFLAGGRRST